MVRRRATERSPGRAERTRSQGVDLGVGPRPVVRGASAVKRRGDEVQLAASPGGASYTATGDWIFSFTG
jgi:hypothetical protein